jgi:hypothetical protein
MPYTGRLLINGELCISGGTIGKFLAWNSASRAP